MDIRFALPRMVGVPCVALAMAQFVASAAGELTAGHSIIQVAVAERSAESVVVTAVDISPDGARIAAAGDDHRVRVWDVQTRELVHLLQGHTDWVRSVRFSPDGKWLASAGNDRRLMLWDVRTGKPLRTSELSEGAIASLAFHPDGTRIAAAGYQRTVNIYETSTCRQAAQWGCPCRDIRCAAFSPDGRLLAVAGRNGRIRILDARDGKSVRDIRSSDLRIRAAAFSPSGAQLAVGGDSAHITIWDTTGGDAQEGDSIEPLHRFPTKSGKVRSLVFLSEDELISGGADNRVAVWSIPTQTITTTLEGHTGTVAALAVDPHTRLIVSGAFDTTLRIWRLNQSSQFSALSSQPDSF